MTVLSVLRPVYSSLTKQVSAHTTAAAAVSQPFRYLTTSLVRKGGGHDRLMTILPSKYQWQKYKDGFHFYLFLGVIPCVALTMFTNIFIGPATLTETPCDYHPKHWEYHRHPISRFMARHFITNPQEHYERNLHYTKELDEARRLRILEKRANAFMHERGDYVYYSGKMHLGKYFRGRLLENEYIESTRGEE